MASQSISRFAWFAHFMVAVALSLGAGTAVAGESYRNPVLMGDHPDPSIIYTGKDFWATCTSSEWGPQFPLLHSTDLVNWEVTGFVFPHRPAWAVANFWAPEISEYNGRYAVYYVGRMPNGPLTVAVATADKPGGPYVDHGPLVGQEDGSIDPSAATDEHGARYLIWKEDGNSQGRPTPIWAQRLDDGGTKLVDQPHELIRNDTDWEGSLVEGPFILRRDGWFYLFYSGNGCCGVGCNYAMGVARSRALLGPWEKDPLNPILAANDTWKCPGHGSVAEDAQGRYWLLCHAYPANGSVFTGREAILDEVKFGADGWPTINDGHGPAIQAASPFGAPQQETGTSYTDDFTGHELEKSWEWPQDLEPVYHLNDGRLRLAGKAGESSFLAAVLARPTTAADYLATTAIETTALKPGTAAGLCAIGDEGNAVGIVYQDGSIITWRRNHGAQRELARQSAPPGKKVWLRLTARRGYRFQLEFSAGDDKWMPVGDATVAKNLPPWDRSVRVALTVGGTSGAEGTFDSFSIQPLANLAK